MSKKHHWAMILLLVSSIFLSVTAQNYFGDNHRQGINGTELGRKRNGRYNKKITPESEKRIISALKEYFPDFYTKAIILKKKHPWIYRRLLRKLKVHTRRLNKAGEEKKDLISTIFEEAGIDILVLKYKNSTNEKEKSNLKFEIMQKLSLGFDKRERIQEKVIRRIEENIALKKEKHLYRIKNKEKIIDERMANLLK